MKDLSPDTQQVLSYLLLNAQMCGETEEVFTSLFVEDEQGLEGEALQRLQHVKAELSSLQSDLKG